jgi:hypothetical protein
MLTQETSAERPQKNLFPKSSAREEEETMHRIRRRTLRIAGLTGRTGGRRRQRDVLCAVMLSASECETWLTLDELAKLTHYPPASISAQLRHLRKPQFGGYSVEKRPRLVGRILHGEDFSTVWECRLKREVRRVVAEPRALPRWSRSAARTSS